MDQKPIPSMFTTCQLERDDTIYMIGGVHKTQDQRDFILTPSVRAIDANLNVVDKSPLKVPRFSIPLALVHDRWILAIGGMIGRT